MSGRAEVSTACGVTLPCAISDEPTDVTTIAAAASVAMRPRIFIL
jgi:hypothetical protein